MRGGLVRTILLVCALAAMGLRVATPPGYMFSAGDDGGVTVTLCSGATATIDLGHGHGKPQQGHAPCAFAAVAHAGSAPETASVAAPFTLAALGRSNAPRLVRIGQGLAAPPPPATGPPVLV